MEFTQGGKRATACLASYQGTQATLQYISFFAPHLTQRNSHSNFLILSQSHQENHHKEFDPRLNFHQNQFPLVLMPSRAFMFSNRSDIWGLVIEKSWVNYERANCVSVRSRRV